MYRRIIFSALVAIVEVIVTPMAQAESNWRLSELPANMSVSQTKNFSFAILKGSSNILFQSNEFEVLGDSNIKIWNMLETSKQGQFIPKYSSLAVSDSRLADQYFSSLLGA